mgnify:FL=1
MSYGFRNITIQVSDEVIALIDEIRGELVSRHKIVTKALEIFLEKNKGVKLEFEQWNNIQADLVKVCNNSCEIQ